MRAIWKGAVSFGLVNVPVRVFAATQEHDIRFHQVHRADGGRIKMRRTCTVCGEEVAWDQLAKGYESPDGRSVVLTDEDLADLPLVTGREIDVVEFVPAEQVDPVLFDHTYYLEPEARATKPYVLLREALAATDRMAVVKVALRQRETLAVLRVREKVIVLQTLLWPDEVREADFDVLAGDVELRPQELAMASSLVESLAADFRPEDFEDSYAKAVTALVEAKLEGVEPVAAAEVEPSGGGDVVDLLTALQRSVERAKASRGEATGEETEGARADGATSRTTSERAADDDGSASGRSAGKTPATKKAAARKSAPDKAAGDTAAAQKAAAKKAAAKKSA